MAKASLLGSVFSEGWLWTDMIPAARSLTASANISARVDDTLVERTDKNRPFLDQSGGPIA